MGSGNMMIGNSIECTWMAEGDVIVGRPEEVFDDVGVNPDEFVEYRYSFFDGKYVIHLVVWYWAEEVEEELESYFLRQALEAFALDHLNDTLLTKEQKQFFITWLDALNSGNYDGKIPLIM